MLFFAALAIITLLFVATTVVINAVVAGLRDEQPMVRWLHPVSRLITAKAEMLELDTEYRRLVAK
jgi:hypothetical protein